jgi:drug/metabolite transporter (DMT)-like permease
VQIVKTKQFRYLLPIAFVVAILAVSTASTLVRLSQHEVPSNTIATLRLAFATLMLAPIALLRHRSELWRLGRSALFTAAISGTFLAVHFAAWISSLEYTTVASSVVFVSTGPLWVALLSPLLLREELSMATVVGLAIALAGGVVIGLADACGFDGRFVCPQLSTILRGRAMLGNSLALVGAWAVAGYLMLGRRLRADLSLVPYVFLVYGSAAIVLAGIMLFSGETPFGYSGETYRWIFLLALVPQLIGHSTFNWALRYVPATLVAVTTLGEPVGSSVLAFFVLGEAPTPAVIAGGILILLGVVIAARTQDSTGKRE